ncbi:hypothetical protein ACTFIU_003634 [Dictyostelium citrinum]
MTNSSLDVISPHNYKILFWWSHNREPGFGINYNQRLIESHVNRKTVVNDFTPLSFKDSSNNIKYGIQSEADGALKELLGNETISLEKIIERYVFYRCFMTLAIFKTFFKDNNFLLNSRFRRFEKKIPAKVRRDFYSIHKLLDIEHIQKQSENKINKLYLCREAQRNKLCSQDQLIDRIKTECKELSDKLKENLRIKKNILNQIDQQN